MTVTRQRRLRRRVRLIALLLILAITATACSTGPKAPDDLKAKAKAVEGELKQAKSAIDSNEKRFKQQIAQEPYAFIGQYSREQQHADRFDQARAKLKQAETVAKNRIKPLSGKYDAAKRAELEQAIAEADGLVKEARQLADDPVQWLDKVVATKSNPAEIVAKAQAAAATVSRSHAALQPVVATAKRDFPDAAARIDQLFQPLNDLQAATAGASTSVGVIGKEQQPNFAVLTDVAQTAINAQPTYASQEASLRSKLSELPSRETHTLIDIRVDTVIVIERTTWNESYDYPTEHDHEYPEFQLDQEATNHFAGFQIGKKLAEARRNDGKDIILAQGVEKVHWDKLGIVESQETWHSGDDHAEYYLGDVEDTYCHKLRVFIDGQPSTAKRSAPAENYCSKYDTPAELAQGIYWEESDELNTDAIGMDVYSKGSGDFADQANEEATPPGMVYVGDSSTGEWRQDSNGNSFWHYYGQYAFFSNLIGGPTPYHYRSEYDEWNRDYRRRDRPYYAGTGGAPRYGGRSPLAASRFPGSTFNSSGLRDATVRNAGPVARAGGPGSGGK